MAAVGMLQPLFKAQGLNGQYLFAPFFSPSPAYLTGQKARGQCSAPDLCRTHPVQIHDNIIFLALCLESSHPPPLTGKLFNIQIPVNDPRLKTIGFPQDLSVFRNQVMSAKDKVCGGFPLAGVSVNVPAYKAGGLSADEISSVIILPSNLVTGRQVGDNCGPGAGVGNTWRSGYPQILAYFLWQRQNLSYSHRKIKAVCQTTSPCPPK